MWIVLTLSLSSMSYFDRWIIFSLDNTYTLVPHSVPVMTHTTLMYVTGKSAMASDTDQPSVFVCRSGALRRQLGLLLPPHWNAFVPRARLTLWRAHGELAAHDVHTVSWLHMTCTRWVGCSCVAHNVFTSCKMFFALCSLICEPDSTIYSNY